MQRRYCRNRGHLDRGFGTWSVPAGQTAAIPDWAMVNDELIEAAPDCELIIIEVPDDDVDLPAPPPPSGPPLVNLTEIFPELDAGPPVEVVEEDYSDLIGSPPVEPEEVPALPSAVWTADELSQLKWAELRALAKNRGSLKMTAGRKELEKLLEGAPKES